MQWIKARFRHFELWLIAGGPKVGALGYIAVVVAALESVDLVTTFDEDTPFDLIAELAPAVLVKGGDYDMGKLAETRLVQSYGGRAQAIPFVEGYSTTALVTRIRSTSRSGRP